MIKKADKQLLNEILKNDIKVERGHKSRNLVYSNEKLLYSTIKHLHYEKEIIGWRLSLSPLQPILTFGHIRETSRFYVEKEIKWYLSKSLSTDDIRPYAKMWANVDDNSNKCNSNYGWAIFSEDNGSQYENVLQKLTKKALTKRAQMIYTRPSMHTDAVKEGMNDFMCTAYVQCFIRNDTLVYIIHQRSCDFIYGFFNDFAWHCFVYMKLFRDLLKVYPSLKVGNITYLCDTLHIYERHYALMRSLSDYVEIEASIELHRKGRL